MSSRDDALAVLDFAPGATPDADVIELRRRGLSALARRTQDQGRVEQVEAAASLLLKPAAQPSDETGFKALFALETPVPGRLDLTPYRRPSQPARPKTPPTVSSQPGNPSLLADFPRGDQAKRPKDVDPNGQAPFASFAPTEMLRSADVRWRPGRLLLGVVEGTEATMPARPDGRRGGRCILGGIPVGVDDDRHVCTFAGSRAGKGRSAIVPNMLTYPGSVLATDIKGELAVITARQRSTLGDVHILDPFGVATAALPEEALPLVTGFNPIMAMRDGSLTEDATLIADAIVVADGENEHFADSARTFIEGLLLHVRSHPSYAGQRHLRTVRLLAGHGPVAAGSGAGIGGLIAEMSANTDDPTGLVRMAAMDFAERAPQEQGSMLSTVRRHLKFIDLFRDSPLGRMALEHDGFRLDAFKKQVTTVYLCLPARHLGTCGRWLRLFVNLTLQAMETMQAGPPPGNAPLLCVLDEFASLGYLRQVEDAAAQIAGFNVKLWTILQDVGQLKALYKDRWQTFLANSGLVQCFGNSDMATLEWVSSRLGKTLVQMHQRGGSGAAEKVGQGASNQSNLYELMTAEEVARFFGRDDPRLRQLVIWAGRHNPFLVLQRIFYDQHELFRPDGRPLFDDPP